MDIKLIKYYDYGYPSLGSSVGSGAALGASLGSIVPGIGTAIGGVVGAAGGLVAGILQRNKGNKLLKNTPYAVQPIPEDVLYNQQLARQRANEGLPSQQYANAMKNTMRTQAGLTRNARDLRSAVQMQPIIQQNTNDQFANLNATNQAAQRQNERQFIGVNSQVAGYRQSAFDWNQKNRYLQNYGYAMSLLGAGNANLIHGIDSGGAALMYGSGLFGGGRPRTINTTTPPAAPSSNWAAGIGL